MSSTIKCSVRLAVALAISALAGASVAQSGLMTERFGIGLKARTDSSADPIDAALGSESARVWQITRPPQITLISGVRDAPRMGLRAVESYGGVAYTARSGWGSSFEAGFAQDAPESARRYSFGGQMHTALSNGRSLSVGLKYSVFDTDSGARPVALSDGPAAHAYTLAPLHTPGAAFGPSYQVQMSYQHSSTSAFGLTFMGQHWLTPSWALSYDVLTSDLANPLRLQGVGLRLGVRYRF
jgi:hypothetical protein